jgi:hypothetical protein
MRRPGLHIYASQSCTENARICRICAARRQVAISAAEEPLGELRVRACVAQTGRLLAWAAAWPQRTWAVEGAGGTGHLLAQQLVSAGERVLISSPSSARGSGCWPPGR